MKLKALALIFVLLLQISLVSALTIDSVTTSPDEIQPGDIIDLELVIENSLNADVENVEVLLNLDSENLPFAPHESSNEVLIEEIDEDEEDEARFKLIVFSDAKAGTYKIPVVINYFLGGNLSQTTGMISIIVDAEAKLNIYEENSLLIRGQKGEIGIRIINSGLGNAKLLNVNVKDAVGVQFLDPQNVYVGNIDSDDFEKIKLEVIVKESATSMVTIPLEITYLDSSNNEKTENKNLFVKIYSKDEAISLGLIKKSNLPGILTGIVVLVVLYSIYRYFKKKRRRK